MLEGYLVGAEGVWRRRFDFHFDDDHVQAIPACGKISDLLRPASMDKLAIPHNTVLRSLPK